MSAALPPQTQTNVTISPQKPAIEPSPRGETHTEYCVHTHSTAFTLKHVPPVPWSRTLFHEQRRPLLSLLLPLLPLLFPSWSSLTALVRLSTTPLRHILRETYRHSFQALGCSSSSASSSLYHHVQPFPKRVRSQTTGTSPVFYIEPSPTSGGGPWCRAVRRCTFSPAVLAKRFSELPGTHCHGLLALEPSHYSRCAVPSTTSNAIHCYPQPQTRGLALLAWSATPPAVLGA
ncbi:hypothetical protein CLIM01_04110 [Colletotrichum limetticola]|uniref:Uncharacterized protein n=1 Tax=Colletotrichum limetticola TaxID=1209924 RepID=A0ABQ9Q4C8_9PEZI|nr:hypothetical protein CLIM01_04110 [Colletotrichum limetticola]